MAKAATILLAAGLISVSTAPLAVAQHGTFQLSVRNDAHDDDDTLDEARGESPPVTSAEHTKTGIMKANWNHSDFRKVGQGDLRFTAEQARLIRDSIGLNSWTHSAAADAHQSAGPRATLNLELRNMTTLSPTVLAEARETLTKYHYVAGIDVQWKTVGADFTVFVISRPPHAVRVSRFALGYVPSDKAKRGRQAFVLAYRVRDRSSELVVSFQLILGLTMAHEVAHLLLPHESHFLSMDSCGAPGVIGADYWKARLGQLLFTDEEAQLMA